MRPYSLTVILMMFLGLFELRIMVSWGCQDQINQHTCSVTDCSPPVFSVCGIFQARILEWVAISYSRGSSQPRDPTCVSYIPCITGRFFTTEPPGKPAHLYGTYSPFLIMDTLTPLRSGLKSLGSSCPPIFTAALFIIAKRWEPPKCSSTDARIAKCGLYR